MANHVVRILRGRDFEDQQEVAVLQYLLPSGQAGLVVLDQIEIMGEHMLIADATDTQIIERVRAYAGGRPFIIDLMNEQHWNADIPLMQKWLPLLHIIFEGEVYLFGIDKED